MNLENFEMIMFRSSNRSWNNSMYHYVFSILQCFGGSSFRFHSFSVLVFLENRNISAAKFFFLGWDPQNEDLPAWHPPNNSLIKVKGSVGGSKNQNPFPVFCTQTIPIQHKLILYPTRQFMLVVSSVSQQAINLKKIRSISSKIFENYRNLTLTHIQKRSKRSSPHRRK